MLSRPNSWWPLWKVGNEFRISTQWSGILFKGSLIKHTWQRSWSTEWIEALQCQSNQGLCCSTNQMCETHRQSSSSSSQENEGSVSHLGIHYGCGCLCSFPSHSHQSIQSSCRHRLADPGKLEDLSAKIGHVPSQLRDVQKVRKQTLQVTAVTAFKQVKWGIFRLTFFFF